RRVPAPRVFARSDRTDVRRLGALLPLRDVVLHPLVLLEVAVALAGDRAEVHEHVGAAVLRSDEAEALLAAEPLHGSSCHVHSLLSLPSGPLLPPVVRRPRQPGEETARSDPRSVPSPGTVAG